MVEISEFCADITETAPGVRLRVIAADDSPGEQAFKLRVRNAAIRALSAHMGACRDNESAWKCVNAAFGDMLIAARKQAAAEGRGIAINGEIGLLTWEDGGRYPTAKLVIGAGRGHNWWSLIYPDLCPGVPGDDVVYCSAILRWLSALLK